MPFEIIPVKSFLDDLKSLSKKYPSLKDDIDSVAGELKSNPKIGEPLGKDCYKIRLLIKSKGKGKSGGGRLITCVRFSKSTVFLLAVYDKSEFESISLKELADRLAQTK